MRPTRLAMLLLSGTVLAASGACGGKLGEDSDLREQSSDKDDGARSPGQDDGGQAGAAGDTTSNRRLEACRLGFLRSEQPSKPCPFITDDGRCYETPEAACDCACPRGKNGELLCVYYGATTTQTQVFCQTL